MQEFPCPCDFLAFRIDSEYENCTVSMITVTILFRFSITVSRTETDIATVSNSWTVLSCQPNILQYIVSNSHFQNYFNPCLIHVWRHLFYSGNKGLPTPKSLSKARVYQKASLILSESRYARIDELQGKTEIPKMLNYIKKLPQI